MRVGQEPEQDDEQEGQAGEAVARGRELWIHEELGELDVLARVAVDLDRAGRHPAQRLVAQPEAEEVEGHRGQGQSEVGAGEGVLDLVEVSAGEKERQERGADDKAEPEALAPEQGVPPH